MRICLDARQAREVMTGLGRYALNLVRELAKLDQDNEYIVLRYDDYPSPLVTQANFQEIIVPYHISTLKNILLGSALINPIEADIYHALFHFLPLGVEAKRVVVTLHDLIWVRHAALAFESTIRQQLAQHLVGPFIGKALQRADHIIAISADAMSEAVDHYHLPREKMTVVHHGIDPVFSMNNVSLTLPPVCPEGRFILSLGHTKPYKNIPRLIQAFAKIAARYPDVKLVIAGRGDAYTSLRDLTTQLALSHRIIFATGFTDLEICACFQKALFLAFPSLVEGFGFPVVEAMAGGCPVLTSNRSSLAEIAGNAALLVDPTDVSSIATGLEELIDNPNVRQKLAQQGRERAQLFQWQQTAQKTLDLYKKL